MSWFKTDAPIRLKLLLAFGFLALLTACAALAPVLFGPQAGFVAGGLATLVAIAAGFGFRSIICYPYVTTVLRMEGLAAGDLSTPIQFTDYQDCVGRMTKAMFAFREAARKQLELSERDAVNAKTVMTMSVNMERLAEGDLTADITDDFPPEYSELKLRFNAALSNLRLLVSGVNDRASAIGTGSQEVAQASEDLARRTESNAASLEETSAALTQVEGRLSVGATASKDTVARADQAIASVGSGRATAEAAMQAMGRVSTSAKGIDSVIEGVDKIAFQTRVLAMNAAVEAGRAGDAGRGFAVVADLVSALAMRAEEEAKRARDQLTVTQAEIVTAVDAVQKVDTALGDISGNVGAVHELLASMADDNMAQSAAITQIAGAIGSMDKATQQNAAMVEETSAAARSLDAEVAALTQQAGQFRTGTASSHVPARAPSHVPARAPAAAMPVRRAKPVTAPVIKTAGPKPAVFGAANDPPKAYANGHAAADGNDWADF